MCEQLVENPIREDLVLGPDLQSKNGLGLNNCESLPAYVPLVEEAKRTVSIMFSRTINVPGNMYSKGKMNTVAVDGTLSSFNNLGRGKQSITDSRIESGASIQNPHRASVPSIGGTVNSFVNNSEGDQNIEKSVIKSGVREVKEEIKEVGIKELWEHLEEIGVEEDSVSTAYMYLSKNPDALKIFNGVPIPKRKKMLPKIMLSKESDRNVKIT
ncbi:unnamed protein product [Sphenostylis stenocarpa]|uniref:Uncharacterized protein n=1 Tax=Sphenostylis stenocarpa TaxID=92480 RepID=A0AA86VSI5_9FABA|nr:unnamed protein product [Sphenostylis stenocarpa]